MVSGLLDQLQIFWQLYLIELLRFIVGLGYSSCGRVWHAFLLHKHKSYGISGQIFGFISSFLSNKQFWVLLDGNFSQEYPVNAGVLQDSILGSTLFLLYINELPDDAICSIGIYDDDITFFFDSCELDQTDVI